MTKMKVGGFVLTGIGAYLILSKSINFLNRTVDDITNASIWKAYYRAFAKTQRTDIPSPKNEENSKNSDASQEAVKGVISDSIEKITTTVLDTVKELKEAKKGLKTHSEATCSEITEEEFMEGFPNYDRVSFIYYKKNDILTDDDGIVYSVEDFENQNGINIAEEFKARPKDIISIYLKNDLMQTCYAIEPTEEEWKGGKE